MTDIQHIDVDSDEFEDAPRGLRDHVKRLQSALKERDQLITEFRGKESDRALGDVLAGFKNPGRVKSDLLSDGIDPLDSEAVTKWLGENGDDYARGEATPAAPEGETTEQAPEVPDYRRLNGVAEIGTPSGVDKAQIVANAPTDLPSDELAQWFIQQGI